MMTQRRCSPCLFAALVVLAAPAQLRAGEDSPYHRTVERVLTLLPKRPLQVVVVDPKQAEGDIRTALLRMDAFVIQGGRVVYLTSHSQVMQGALKGWPLHEHILAAIIWHEMAHLDGADEGEAQRREEALWTQYVMEDRVDRGDGLRYLAALRDLRRKEGAQREGHAVKTLRGPLMTSPIAVITRD